MRTTARHISLFSLVAVFHSARICYAFDSTSQRGLPFPQSAPPATPTDGFPGFFDSNMADKGTIVADLPTFQVDYGINEKWTVGVNGLALAVGVASSAPSVVVKARYRLFSNESFRNALTTYLGYIDLPSKEDNNKLRMSTVLFSNNTTFYLTPSFHLNSFVIVGFTDLTQGKESTVNYAKASVTPVVVGAGANYFLGRVIGFSALGLYNVYTTIEIDTSEMAIDFSTSPLAHSSTYAIKLASDIRLGDFLLSPYAFFYFSAGTASTIPFLNLMYRW